MGCETKRDSPQAVTKLAIGTTTSHSEQASKVASELAQLRSATFVHPMACDMTGNSSQAATKLAIGTTISLAEQAPTTAPELAQYRSATSVQPSLLLA